MDTVHLPDGVPLTIASYTFYGCTKLNSINLDAVTQIGTLSVDGKVESSAFYGCTSLTEVNLSSVEVIGQDTFSGCTGLKTVNAPKCITIDQGAFADCTSLKSISTEADTFIGTKAFAGCTALEDISLPESTVGGFYDYAADCPALVTLDISSMGKESEIYSGTNGNMPESMCAGLEHLTTVKAGNVTGIGGSAFAGCTALKDVEISSAETINTSAFSGCSALEKIELPDSVTFIYDNAFENCSSLESVEIPEKVVTLNNYVFSGCENLTSVVIDGTITDIGDFAFQDCTNLQSITLENGVKTIREGSFQNCENLTEITLPYGLHTIGKNAFNGCKNLTTITIPITVTSIGADAFTNCGTLETIICPCVFSKPDMYTNTGIYNFDNTNDDFQNSGQQPGKFKKSHMWNWEPTTDPSVIISNGCVYGDYERTEKPTVTIYAPMDKGQGAYLKSNQDADGNDLCNVEAELPAITYVNTATQEESTEVPTEPGTYTAYIQTAESFQVVDSVTDDEVTYATYTPTAARAEVSYTIAEDGGITVEREQLASFTMKGVGAKTYGDDPFTLSMDKELPDDAKGQVIYTSDDATILSIDGDTATILRAGTVTITATYPEDDRYLETTATMEVEIAKAKLTVRPDSKVGRVASGDPLPKFDWTTKPETLPYQDRCTDVTLLTGDGDTSKVSLFYEVGAKDAKIQNEQGEDVTDCYDITYGTFYLLVDSSPTLGGDLVPITPDTPNIPDTDNGQTEPDTPTPDNQQPTPEPSGGDTDTEQPGSDVDNSPTEEPQPDTSNASPEVVPKAEQPDTPETPARESLNPVSEDADVGATVSAAIANVVNQVEKAIGKNPTSEPDVKSLASMKSPKTGVYGDKPISKEDLLLTTLLPIAACVWLLILFLRRKHR